MSTRSSIYFSDPEHGPKIHVFFEHMTERHEMEVEMLGRCGSTTLLVPVSEAFALALAGAEKEHP